MAKLSVKQLMEVAKGIVKDNPGGIRHGELRRKIMELYPETAGGTLDANLSGLAQRFPGEIAKPSHGLFVPVDPNTQVPVEVEPPPTPATISEAAFYQPFAEFLRDELEEVVVASPLGGAGLKEKWGTPDVVGVYKPLAKHKIPFSIEIVTAEIKTNPSESITAFGQAVSYRLFSARVYLVMPSTTQKKDLGRLESLAILTGIGLVTFDFDPAQPRFRIRTRAQTLVPDMFYVNEFADRLSAHDPDVFQKLFG